MAKKLRVVAGNAKAADTKTKGSAKAATKAEAKIKAAKAPAVKKFKGAKSGLSVREFQNQLMARNFKAKLTDEQLAKAMREEFPAAIPYTVEHVRGIRSAWNKGKHGNDAPERQLPEFDDDGKALPLWGEKSAAKKAAAAKPAKKAAKKAKPADDEDEDDDEEVEEEDEE